MTTKQFVTVAQSQPTCGPGVYSVTAPGITLTLETWAHWHDQSASIVVKDLTGADQPNITVNAPSGGAIDGGSSVVMANPKEALIFRPYKGGNTYSVTG